MHAALIAIIALFGLSFLLDPCGGGGDLCLGGALGLTTLGVAAFGVVALLVWGIGRRASPLLVLDCTLVVLAVAVLAASAFSGPAPVTLGALLMVVLGVPAAALAARAVATHRVESVVAFAALIGVAILGGGGAGGVAVPVLGLAVLGLAWLSARTRGAPSASLDA
jgi:hypothetical protein